MWCAVSPCQRSMDVNGRTLAGRPTVDRLISLAMSSHQKAAKATDVSTPSCPAGRSRSTKWPQMPLDDGVIDIHRHKLCVYHYIRKDLKDGSQGRKKAQAPAPEPAPASSNPSDGASSDPEAHHFAALGQVRLSTPVCCPRTSKWPVQETEHPVIGGFPKHQQFKQRHVGRR